jgi:hypothetical protein
MARAPSLLPGLACTENDAGKREARNQTRMILADVGARDARVTTILVGQAPTGSTLQSCKARCLPRRQQPGLAPPSFRPLLPPELATALHRPATPATGAVLLRRTRTLFGRLSMDAYTELPQDPVLATARPPPV